eukprot:470535-Hanusia_phi.AAC.1
MLGPHPGTGTEMERTSEEMVNSSWLKAQYCRPEQPNKTGKEGQRSTGKESTDSGYNLIKRRRPQRDTKLSDWFTPVNDEDRDGIEPTPHGARGPRTCGSGDT